MFSKSLFHSAVEVVDEIKNRIPVILLPQMRAEVCSIMKQGRISESNGFELLLSEFSVSRELCPKRSQKKKKEGKQNPEKANLMSASFNSPSRGL